MAFLPLSSGGVGFDINCGVRLVRTNLHEKDVAPVKEQLAQVRPPSLYRIAGLLWGEPPLTISQLTLSSPFYQHIKREEGSRLIAMGPFPL